MSGSTAISRPMTIAAGELQVKFTEMMRSEITVNTQFEGAVKSIIGGKEQWNFLKGIARLTRHAGEKVGALAAAQSTLIEAATEAELQAWGVTREDARDELRMDELNKFGQVYKASVKRRQNYNMLTEKFWGPNWIALLDKLHPPWPSVEFARQCSLAAEQLSFDHGMDLKDDWLMVEDIRWVLQDRELPPVLPAEQKKYHAGYVAKMTSIGEAQGGAAPSGGSPVAPSGGSQGVAAGGNQGVAAGGSQGVGGSQEVAQGGGVATGTKRSGKRAGVRSRQGGELTKRKRERTLEMKLPAYQKVRFENAEDEDCDPEILRLLEVALPEEMRALDEETKEDIELIEKIREMLGTVGSQNEDKWVPGDRIARRLRMLISGLRMKAVPVKEETTNDEDGDAE
ncbi:hypothetical protein BGX38DRAFT_1277874 [Terfezia claveryi]|nr:hypothetical protein BGX38DRAFT_1277874 [Terfezia claveryi]